MVAVEKSKLFKSRLPEGDVEVDGVGTVRVRGLSRSEVLAVRKVSGIEAIERRMLSLAMVAPKLTEDEVGKWQDASQAGEMEPVTSKVQELSGMASDAAKQAYKEFESAPDAEFRLPPG